MSNAYAFPPGFRWGVATAAFQIEGATAADGRSPSVWDGAHRRGLVRTGESGDIACDHYRRFRDDVKLMADLGIRHYRFSLSWPRILPAGRGPVNEAGVDFYKRLIDCLGEHGITPHATLFHWDSPQCLEDEYGTWRSRRIADDLAGYAAVAADRLSDRVGSWMVMNEILCFTLLAYTSGRIHTGMHAPGVQVASEKERWQTVHHALLAHGRAVQALRAHARAPIRIATVDNAFVPVPLSETPADIAAARLAIGDQHNGGILLPLLTGRYGERWHRAREARGELPDIAPGDMEIIAQPLDGLGLNLYSGGYVRAGGEDGVEHLPFPEGYPRLHMPWLQIVPDVLYWGPRLVREALGFDKPVFISENGCAADDQLTPAGEVLDTDRIHYLRSYLRSLHRAVAEGYPVEGYFLWSFLDNFEWSWGYARRFGIVWTDYQTQRRLPKASAHWYAEVIRQNRVV